MATAAFNLARQTQGFGRGHGVAQVLEDSLQPMHAPLWQETHDGQHLCWHQVDTNDPEIKNHSKKMKFLLTFKQLKYGDYEEHEICGPKKFDAFWRRKTLQIMARIPPPAGDMVTMNCLTQILQCKMNLLRICKLEETT